MKKKVLCIGGGTGQSAILSALKKIDNIEIVAIVGVTDNGGYSGIIREAMSLPQPGDSRNCISAISAEDSILSDLIKYRFTEGDLKGISLGNLVIAALARIKGNFTEAIIETNKLVSTKGLVLPVSNDYTHICAELEDGTKVEGEWEIIKRENKTKIRKMYLKNSAKATKEVLKEIESSDLIVICPGSLCTAIVSVLITEGINEAISNSNAKIAYICNIMTQKGQTEDFSSSEHLNLISQYIDRSLDYIFINSKIPPKVILDIYEKENSKPVFNDLENLGNGSAKIILDDFFQDIDEKILKDLERPKGKGMHVGPHYIRHDIDKIVKNIIKILF